MPFGRLRSHMMRYFAPHPSQELREQFLSTAMLDFAVCMIVLFEPIYLYTLGWSLPQILLFYAAVYVLYFFLLPLGGRIGRRFGYEHAILYSSPFLVIWYLSVFAIAKSPVFVGTAVVALAMQKMLYWPGYHANFATWGNGGEQSREVSSMAALSGMMAALAPVVGGLIIAKLGFAVLFALVSALILLSNVPLLRTPEQFKPQPFPYGDAFRRLLEPGRRRQLIGALGYGEEMLAFAVWPVFLALTVAGVQSVGAIASFSMLVSVLMILYIGRISDDGDRSAVIRSGAFYTGAAWLVRMTVGGGFGAFLVDSFYRVSKGMVAVPLMASVYDGARRHSKVMENVVAFEMVLCFGKALAAVLAALVLSRATNAWWAVFALSAAFSALYAVAGEDVPADAPLPPASSPTVSHV